MTVHAERQKTKSAAGSESLPLSHRWLWTVKKFQRAHDLGMFGFDTRLELIEGEIIRKMPQNEPHTRTIRAMEEALRSAFASGHDVQNQLPLVFGVRNKPEPDVTVVAGSFNDYKRKHPTTAVLVVEVSDSTLVQDRTAKAGVYARAGIEEYWIVNLPDNVLDNVLEVHRQPTPMADQPLGHHYRSIVRLTAADTLASLGAPDSVIAVASLLF